jgi:rhodanese/phosphatase family protein/2-cysteine adaptor domain-containing protein
MIYYGEYKEVKLDSVMDYSERFHANSHINPVTGRKIKIGGPTWLKLAKMYGHPTNCELPIFIVPSRDKPPHSRANFLTEDGRIIIGSYPQHTDSGLCPDRLIDYGVTVMVNLTPKQYKLTLSHRSDDSPITINFPIGNGKAPSKQATMDLIDRLVELYDIGHIIYIHCMGGHGRAGTIGAILIGTLCELDGVESISIVEACRGMRSDTSRNFIPTPETDQQVRLVLSILGDGGKTHPDRSDRSWMKYRLKRQL